MMQKASNKPAAGLEVVVALSKETEEMAAKEL
jgi:hypothetical protein